jgi:hypothetical protein
VAGVDHLPAIYWMELLDSELPVPRLQQVAAMAAILQLHLPAVQEHNLEAVEVGLMM